MTYLARRHRSVVRTRRGRPALSGVTDVLETLGLAAVSPAVAIGRVLGHAAISASRTDSSECLPAADAATATIDAKWQEISKTWNPNGNFSPADMNKVVTEVFRALNVARIDVTFSPHSTSDAGDVISQALDDIGKKLDQGATYVQAVKQAQDQGVNVISSPGFKDWVVTSYIAVSTAYATRAVLECDVSWLQKVSDFLDAIGQVVSRVVDIAIKAGDTALDIVDDTLDAYKYIKWGAVAVGVWWILNEMKKRRA